MSLHPLTNRQILSLALNLPGPLAVAQLHRLGAAVIKIEPASGDALFHASPKWYEQLHQGLQILNLNLKDHAGQQQLEDHLRQSHLLVTSMRFSALERLGLAWEDLHTRHPHLCHIALIGNSAPWEEQPGHDLNYQAQAGLLSPPQLPRTCLADLAGAERTVSTALALLLACERGQEAQFAQVSLADIAKEFANPWEKGLTKPTGLLGGGHLGYQIYPAKEGWIALAALEVHFWEKLLKELNKVNPGQEQLEQIFRTKSALEWEKWAQERDLPLTKVND